MTDRQLMHQEDLRQMGFLESGGSQRTYFVKELIEGVNPVIYIYEKARCSEHCNLVRKLRVAGCDS